MIDRLRGAVLGRWRELGIPGAAPRDLSFHLCDDGMGRAGRALVRVFPSGDSHPALIAKFPRSGAARARAEREHRLLRELEEAAPRLAGRRFPRALLLEDDGDRLFTVQSVIPGEPLADQLRAFADVDDARRLFDDARDWLGQIWRATGLFEAGEAAMWEPVLRAALAALESEGGGAKTRDIETLIAAIEARAGTTCLAAVSHGDLGAGNLLGDSGELGAVDWEHGRLHQFSWIDPVAFALDIAVRLGQLRGDDAAGGFRRAFLDDGPLRTLVLGFLEDCLTECGTPADVLRLAVPALALSRARSRSATRSAALSWRCIATQALAARGRLELSLR
ncbi:MAG: phosphotransferase family protein [Candidatus Eiseniibacteriota bacterium]